MISSCIHVDFEFAVTRSDFIHGENKERAKWGQRIFYERGRET